MTRRLAMQVCAVAAAGTAWLWAGAAAAHHSFAMYDIKREVTLEGVVREFQWTNPHCWIQLISRDPNGKDVEWSIEGASPNNLVRFGWTRNSLKIGDRVQAVIHPLKTGEVGGSLVSIAVNGQPIGAAQVN